MAARGRPFVRGSSGNPGGRPKQDVTVAELARLHGVAAIEVFIQVMNNEKNPASVRVAAAEKVLDRGYGRPVQINLNDSGQVRRAADLTDDQLAAIISGGEPATSAPTEPETDQPPIDPRKVN